jgi:hypothetical protein
MSQAPTRWRDAEREGEEGVRVCLCERETEREETEEGMWGKTHTHRREERERRERERERERDGQRGAGRACPVSRNTQQHYGMMFKSMSTHFAKIMRQCSLTDTKVGAPTGYEHPSVTAPA